MNCVNIKHKDFIQLEKDTKIPGMLLEMRVSKWQEENNTDNFPSASEILAFNPNNSIKVSSSIFEAVPDITEEKIQELYNNYIGLMNTKRAGKGMPYDIFKNVIRQYQVIKYKDTYIFGNYNAEQGVFVTRVNSSPTSKELLAEAIPSITRTGLSVMSLVPKDVADKYKRSGYTVSKQGFDYNYKGEDMVKYLATSTPEKVKQVFGKDISKLTGKEIAEFNQSQELTYKPVEIRAELIQQAGNDLSNILETYLNQFGIVVEDINNIKENIGIDEVGIADILSKIAYIKDRKDLPPIAGEFIAYMMQYNPLVSSIVKDLIKTNAVPISDPTMAAEYKATGQFDYKKLDKTAQLKYIGNLIAQDLQNKLEGKYEKSLIDKIKELIQTFFDYLTNSNIHNINKNVGIISNNILQQNKKLITASLYKPGAFGKITKQVSLKDAMKSDKFGNSIIDKLSKKGFILTGSTSLGEQGTIQRPNENLLHDIDWVSPFNRTQTEQLFKEVYPDAVRIRDIYSTEYVTDTWIITPEGYRISNLQLESDYNIITSYDLLDKDGNVAGTFRLERKVAGGNKEEVTTGVEAKVIDFFSYDKYTGKKPFVKNNVQLSNWKDIFSAKLAFARYKDIWDYNRFVPNENANILLRKNELLNAITDENAQNILNTIPNKKDANHGSFLDTNKVYKEINMFNLFNGKMTEGTTSKDVLSNLIASGALNENEKLLAEMLLNKVDSKIAIVESLPDNMLMGYDTKQKYIVLSQERLNSTNPQEIIEGFLHEAIHNVMYSIVNNPQSIDEKLFGYKLLRLFNRYNELYNNNNIPADEKKKYGLKNVQEFVAEIVTNPEFRQLLDELDSTKKSLWQQLIEFIESLFGISKSGIIKDVMRLSESYDGRAAISKTTLAKIAHEDLLTNLETTQDKYSNAISRIKESLDYNINNFTNISNRVRYYDEKAADNWDKYIQALRDIKTAIAQFQEIEPADSLSYFLDAMDASLEQITNRLNSIDYENVEEAIKTYEIYSGYLDTYNVIGEVSELLAHMKENKDDNTVLNEEDIKNLDIRLNYAKTQYDDLSNRFKAVRGNILAEVLNKPLFFPNIITEHKKSLIKEYKDKGLNTDRDVWISDKLYNRDKDIISEKIKKEVNKLINNPAFDIYGSDVKLSSVTNISSPLLQIMNQIITNIKNERTEIERLKDIEFNTLFRKLVDEKGTNNIKKLYANILDKDKSGKSFIKGAHKIGLYDVIKDFKLKDNDYKSKLADLDIELREVRDEFTINSQEYKDVLAKKRATRKERDSAKMKFLKANFELTDKNEVIAPLAKWKTDESNLTETEKEVLNFFRDLTEENNKFFNGAESLVKYQFKAKFYELPKVTKSDAERLWTGEAASIVTDKYTDLTKERPDDFGYTTQYTDLTGEKINRLKVHFRDRMGTFENKDQSLDLMTIMRMDYQASNAHKIRKESEPILKMLVELAGSKQYYEMTGTRKVRSSSTGKYNLKSGSSSNTYAFAMNMLETKFYDELHKSNVKLGNVDANKAVGFFNNATAFMTLSLNIASGTANVINAQAQLFLESFIKGKYIKASSIAKANKLYSVHLLDTLSDVTNPVNNSYINQINEMFDIHGLFMLTEASFLKSDLVKKGVNMESLQVLQDGGEHYIQSVITMAVLDGVKVMNSDHKYINKDGKVVTSINEAASLLDMLQKDEGGLVNLNENVVYTSHSNLVKWNEGGKTQVDSLIDKKIKDSIGNYKKMDQPDLMRHWYGKLLLLFRKYLIPMGQARLRGIEYSFIPENELTPDQRRYSYALQEYEEGTYVTLIRYIVTALKNKKVSLLMTNWAELSDYEKVNIKRSVTELIMSLAILPLLTMLVMSAADGDDDEELYFLAYQLRRLETELAAYWSISENLKMLRSPIPSSRLIETALGIFGALATPWNLGDEYETGEFKGQNKFTTRLKRKIPVVKEFNRQYETLFNFQNRPGGGFGY